jgi:uncharacterized protein
VSQETPRPADASTGTDRDIERILDSARTIAVVGLSANPDRESNRVAAYLQRQGYRIIPVNPEVPEALGERAYPDLASIPAEVRIDVVDVFRRVEFVPEVVGQALGRGVGAIWLQLGLRDEASAARARAAGVPFVQDRCLKVEHGARPRS